MPFPSHWTDDVYISDGENGLIASHDMNSVYLCRKMGSGRFDHISIDQKEIAALIEYAKKEGILK